LLAVLMLFAAALTARLTFWQVLEHGKLTALQASEQVFLDVQQPLRGQIFDDQGNTLVTDVNTYRVDANPPDIKTPHRTANLLAPVVHESAADIYHLLTTNDQPVEISPPVSVGQGQKIRNLALPGIMLDPRVVRAYPRGTEAAQLLGFTNDQLQGQAGLEEYYDRWLAGTAGIRSVLRDTAGNNVRVGSQSPIPAHNGADLHLTIDNTVQGLVEDELAKAVKAHHATGGSIIVMDPRSGAIKGMAGYPTFNPNNVLHATDRHALYVNPITQDTYEPGSTMKIITMAAGIDSGVITPQTTFYDSGLFQVGDTQIHNWNNGAFGPENMVQVLQHSANVGASFVANRLGINRFYSYTKRFRIGQPTGIDLPGESAGLVPLPGDKRWTLPNLYTNSFGQGLAITPLQLITAVDAVANHGVMMRPQLVRRMVYDGRIITKPPVAEGRVISARSAHTVTDMLLHSAIDGEAAMALVKGYNIAAKTGTANIAAPGGGYLQGVPGNTIASVIGYAPAFHPKLLILVKIDRPRDIMWGSEVAAPVLHNLFQELFMYYHIPPNPNALNK
jgi:cell division protein FtsI/penicillin-binding protein 2